MSEKETTPSRIWYYLLEFNDKTSWEYIEKNFNKRRLIDLTKEEIKELFIHATKTDIDNL